MSKKQVNIKLEYSDIKFQLIHTLNAFDDDPTNDIVTAIPIEDFTGVDVIPYEFEKGHTHALTVVGSGRKGATLKIAIDEIAVKGNVTVDNNRRLVDTLVFNVY